MRNKVFFLENERTNERISERVNERANEKVTRFVIFAHFLFTDLGLPTFLAPNLVLNNTICSTAFIKKSELLWINTDPRTKPLSNFSRAVFPSRTRTN